MKHLLFVPILCLSLAFSQADISVSPDSLTAELGLLGMDSSQVIIISNTGTSELDWYLEIVDPDYDFEYEHTFTNCGRRGAQDPQRGSVMVYMALER